MARRLSRNKYTVGWVCALSDEFTAAQEMLDEEHQDLPPISNDSNIYTLGCIGSHNIVIACLPAGQMGTNTAVAVAIQMKTTFPAIRFGLMVGIGGGVPGKGADVRLGDIVVSQPTNGHGGVVQYDFGKSTPNGFKRTGFLNAPSPVLLAAIMKLRSNLDRGRNSLSPHLSKLSNIPKFSRDQAGSDVLYEAEYNHVGENDCASCAAARRTQRNERANNAPMIHYGTIASGNQLMKDGVERDKISSEFEGVLCFEMWAAGLMNILPCLVIRGICDYADSHKNKTWQPYAAATAAAYAKELLGVIPAADVVNTKTADEATREQYLPLAITQAAAYINVNISSISEYLRLLKNTEHDALAIMSTDFGDKTRYQNLTNAVAKTWAIAFNKILEHDTLAVHLLERVVAIQAEVLSEDHPDRLLLEMLLASFCKNTSKMSEKGQVYASTIGDPVADGEVTRS